ncbi:MAG: hypothetical protein E6K82_27340 [Candidatus Rokuibacteriota bacterium]|nr:MAG: hypothetical protein E6K82_27340 [Candidatus Rokubacteria bacterium]
MSESGAIQHLADEGFTEHFAVRDDALRGLDGGQTFRPDEVVIRSFVRFEGVSDPDDMSIVYAIEGRGGIRGTLVDAFGVYSNPAIAHFVDAIPPPPPTIDPHVDVAGD